MDSYNNRIRRVDSEGVISTVAGMGIFGYSGDGGPATAASLGLATGIAVGSDGSLYIADRGNRRVRRVDLSGIITTVAGNGSTGYSGDGGPAAEASLSFPNGITVSPEGTIYFTSFLDSRVRCIDSSGIISTVAGNGIIGYSGDGGPATEASLGDPKDVVVGVDGNLYIADRFTVRCVDPTGIITTVAGNYNAGYSGDGGPAKGVRLRTLLGITISPDDSLYLVDVYSNRIRRVAPQITGMAFDEYLVPAANGQETYIFDGRGRHLRTLDTRTKAVLYQFTYNNHGYLTAVEDSGGNITQVERDTEDRPLAIIAPDGQRTALTVDTHGYLAAISNPAGERTAFTYSSDGLLLSMTDPLGNTTTMTYDTTARLIKDENPVGGFKALSRTDTDYSHIVTVATALGRTTSYQVRHLLAGDTQRTNTYADGRVVTTLLERDGTTTVTQPDGTVTADKQGPDPRFGMQVPVTQKSTTITPGGLQSVTTNTRRTRLSNPADPFSLTQQTDTTVVNGNRTYTTLYDAASRIQTHTTPQGRQVYTTLDAQGRVAESQVKGLFASSNSYDSRGRLSTVTVGTGTEERTTTLSYDSSGYPASISDSLGPVVGFQYDLAGRVTSQTLPDGRGISYSYDASGNLTSITPPGRLAHNFTYNAVHKTTAYTPPDPGLLSTATSYTYNLDSQLTTITRPDGQQVELGYLDCCGKLGSITLPRGQISYNYEPVTRRLSTITAPDGNTLSYSYDGFLPLTETYTGEVAGIVARGYDNNFWITSLEVNGTAIPYSYDLDGLVSNAGDLTLTRNSSNGLLAGTSLGTVTTNQSYNGFGELTDFQATQGGTELYQSGLIRDKRGRITEKSETIGGLTSSYGYVYDIAGRLVEVKKDGVTASLYSYDENGNRLSRIAGGVTVNGSYDAQDRMTQYGAATYSYSANGELESKEEAGAVSSYNYDVLGNLLAVTLPDTTQISYLVDGANRRIGKKVNGTLVQGFLYQDILNPIAELDGTGAVKSRFVYGSRNNVPDYLIQGGVSFRIISDQLGSPRLVVNSDTGEIVQRLDYDEFGNVTLDTNPGFQPFGYAGGLYDQDTNLVRFGARDYDPATGHWTSKDPIRFKGGDTNLYGYVANDPVNFTDPDGRILANMAVGAIIGGIASAYSNYGKLSGADYAKAIIMGMGVGALSSIPGGGLLGAMLKGAAASSAMNLYGQITTQDCINKRENRKSRDFGDVQRSPG